MILRTKTLNNDLCLTMGRKHCKKRRKCWFPAFSPFPTMFLKTPIIEDNKKIWIVWKRITISLMHQQAHIKNDSHIEAQHMQAMAQACFPRTISSLCVVI